jgi:predicted phage replisome organizer
MTGQTKKYFWLKLDRNFFKRHDIQIVESMPNGKDYVLFYLKLLVESIDHEGMLRFNEMIPYNDSMLATITNTNIDIVRSAIKVFQELKLMELFDDKTLYLKETQKMLGESSSTQRVKAFRERQKQAQLIHRNVTETLHETEIEKEIDIEIEKEKDIKTKKEPVVYFENLELNKTFIDFMKMRKSLKNGAMTERAIKMMINKLNGYDIDISIQMLEQSILNNWKDVYDLKVEHKKLSKTQEKDKRTDDMLTRAMKEGAFND